MGNGLGMLGIKAPSGQASTVSLWVEVRAQAG